MARDPVRDLANQTAQQLADRLEDNAENTQQLVDPITRLSLNTGTLKDVQKDNIAEARYLRNSILQQNNVLNKLTEVTKKADGINVKALGQSITLEKIIAKNSNAINDSSVGYLRAAEAFVNNFGAGIRRTEGGTLRLTEQLILTGQDQQSFRDVNKSLLGATGRNYDALGEFNDSILESADSYQIATSQLLDGIKRLQGDFNQFALFGPQVASNLATEFSKVLAEFQGLNEEQIGSFMKLGQGGLGTRPTRELLGVQDFFNNMAQGAVAAEDIRANMISAGDQIASMTAGQDFDVAIETIAAKFRINQTDAANLVMLSQTLQAGASNDADLLATTEDQKKTLENQAQLANKYYEKIAPATLDATTRLMVPLLQISQGINLMTALQGFGKSGLNLAGGPATVSRKISLDSLKSTQQVAHSNVMMHNAAVSQTKATKGMMAPFKNLTNAIKDRMPRNFGTFARSGVGLMGAGMGTNMLAGAAGGEETVAGQLLGNAGGFLSAAAMAKMLVPGLAEGAKMSLKGGLAAGALGVGLGVAKDKFGVAEKEGADLGDAMDVGSRALQGASYGAIFGGVGMAVGGALGGLYGLYEEYTEDDTKLSEEQLKVQKEEQAARRDAETRMRTQVRRSDFVLMSIVEGVRRQSENLAGTDSARVAELLEQIRDLQSKNNRDTLEAAVDAKRGDLNDR
jgi:hypothetical protein